MIPRALTTFEGLVAQALSQIRRIIRECEGLSRSKISHRVSRYFGWRCANGALAVQSTMGLLCRLERDGQIRLPPLRSRFRPIRPRAPVIAPVASSAFEPPVLLADLYVRPLRLEERDSYRALLERHHYLGWRKPPGNVLGHVAFLGSKVVALIGWATATLHNRARDAWIGWGAAARSRNLRYVATNVRFLMLPGTGESVENLASRVLGASLRRLSRDWQALHGHPILLAETFVDPSRYLGTCYRASNWIFVGQTSGWSRRGKSYSFHGQSKAVYVYPLHRRTREWLSLPAFASAREGNSMELDVSRLPLEGEGGLLDVLRDITDPRHRRGVRHKAQAILAMAVTAVVAGMKSVCAIAQWIEDLAPEHRERLGGNRYRKPSRSTIRRFLSALDVSELDRKVGAWLARRVDFEGQGLALDGKTLRGSRDGGSAAVHLVSAVLHRGAEVVAQTKVHEKSNEITSVEPLLAGLDVAGATITGDAMFAQTAIAEHLVTEKKADYVFTVKDNQPGLRQAIENMGLESFSPSVHPDEPGPRAERNP